MFITGKHKGMTPIQSCMNSTMEISCAANLCVNIFKFLHTISIPSKNSWTLHFVLLFHFVTFLFCVSLLNTLLNTLSVTASSSKNDLREFALGKYTYKKDNLQLVYKDHVIQQLTFRENKLLFLLVLKQNELCSHKEILNTIWGKNDFFNKKSLNVFISRLRKYLRKDPSIKIENIHNLGFILKIEK